MRMARFWPLFFALLLTACGQSGDLYLPGSDDAPKRLSEMSAPTEGADTDAAADEPADDKDNDDDAEQRSDAR